MREYDFVFSFVLHSRRQTPKRKSARPDYERYSVLSLHFVPVRLLMLGAIICSTNGPYIFMYIFLFSLILFCGKP